MTAMKTKMVMKRIDHRRNIALLIEQTVIAADLLVRTSSASLVNSVLLGIGDPVSVLVIPQFIDLGEYTFG